MCLGACVCGSPCHRVGRAPCRVAAALRRRRRARQILRLSSPGCLVRFKRAFTAPCPRNRGSRPVLTKSVSTCTLPPRAPGGSSPASRTKLCQWFAVGVTRGPANTRSSGASSSPPSRNPPRRPAAQSAPPRCAAPCGSCSLPQNVWAPKFEQLAVLAPRDCVRAQSRVSPTAELTALPHGLQLHTLPAPPQGLAAPTHTARRSSQRAHPPRSATDSGETRSPLPRLEPPRAQALPERPLAVKNRWGARSRAPRYRGRYSHRPQAYAPRAARRRQPHPPPQLRRRARTR